MAQSPYSKLPATAFWRDAVGDMPAFLIDPMIAAPFAITHETRVATGGSCFAQHIARRLRALGFAYYVADAPGADMAADEAARRGFGMFSARYGNIYTTRQLVQLFDRAFGRFKPMLRTWPRPDGRFVDPYRPRIEPDGFATAAECEAATAAHLADVRRMFETLDVFVFTLGLTESWRVKVDGAVLPIAPGAVGGAWPSQAYEFANFSAAECAADLIAFIDRLRSVNPAAKMILTVSPVPLVATYSGAHVMQATAYSKAALRVAAEEAARARPDVAYFPSFEIVTSAANAHRYFEPDLRNVNTLGVDHVMRVFFRHFAGMGNLETAQHAGVPDMPRWQPQTIVCDEETLAEHRRLAAGGGVITMPETVAAAPPAEPPAAPPVTPPNQMRLLVTDPVEFTRRASRKVVRIARRFRKQRP